MSPPLVDYHCHLDLYPKPAKVFLECGKARTHILSVTTTPLAWEQNNLFRHRAQNLRVGLGLHPQLVGQPLGDLSEFAKRVSATRFIGEVGLDAGPRFYKSLAQQESVFSEIIRLCVRHSPKIISIHCVRAYKQLFQILDNHWQPSAGTLVLHWFSGGATDIRKALERDCYFSINPRMASSSTVKKSLTKMPLDRLLTETDGPFAAAIDNQPLKPGEVESSIDLIASLKKINTNAVREAIWANVQRIESGM